MKQDFASIGIKSDDCLASWKQVRSIGCWSEKRKGNKFHQNWITPKYNYLVYNYYYVVVSVLAEVSDIFLISDLVSDVAVVEEADEDNVSKFWSDKGPAARHPSNAPFGFWVNPEFKVNKKIK